MALYSYGALYSHGPTWSWPYVVMALYGGRCRPVSVKTTSVPSLFFLATFSEHADGNARGARGADPEGWPSGKGLRRDASSGALPIGRRRRAPKRFKSTPRLKWAPFRNRLKMGPV